MRFRSFIRLSRDFISCVWSCSLLQEKFFFRHPTQETLALLALQLSRMWTLKPLDNPTLLMRAFRSVGFDRFMQTTNSTRRVQFLRLIYLRPMFVLTYKAKTRIVILWLHFLLIHLGVPLLKRP